MRNNEIGDVYHFSHQLVDLGWTSRQEPLQLPKEVTSRWSVPLVWSVQKTPAQLTKPPRRPERLAGREERVVSSQCTVDPFFGGCIGPLLSVSRLSATHRSPPAAISRRRASSSPIGAKSSGRHVCPRLNIPRYPRLREDRQCPVGTPPAARAYPHSRSL